MDEQEKDREWLGELTSLDLTDMSFGTFDLSRGSTKEWWERVKEIPMTFLELEKFSDEDLANELKRRGKLIPVLKPAVLEPLDWKFKFAPLVKICEDYLDEAWYKDYTDEDFPHWIFETAMTCVFGDRIFERIQQHRSSK